MALENDFYIFYQQINKTGSPNRLVVFYNKDSLTPSLAYRLKPNMRIPKQYVMLESLIVTRSCFNMLLREYETWGILQAYGRAIPGND